MQYYESKTGIRASINAAMQYNHCLYAHAQLWAGVKCRFRGGGILGHLQVCLAGCSALWYKLHLVVTASHMPSDAIKVGGHIFVPWVIHNV